MPIMKETDFQKHISQKQYKNLYFLDGEEKMLVGSYTNKLVEKLMGKEPAQFNYHTFTSDCDISDISVAVCVAPFMSELNLVKVSDLNIDDLKSEDLDAIIKIADTIPDTTVLILTMPTLTPPQKMSKKYKSLRDVFEKKGIVAAFDRRSELSLERTLCRWASQAGSKMSEIVAHKLITTSTNDLNILHSEVEKLSAFADGKEITEEMISLLVSKNLQARIYDLFDLVISKNFDKAMKTVDILFYQREEPVSIVVTLGLAYVDMYRAKIAYKSSIGIKQASALLSYKNRSWVLEKMARQARNIPTSALRESISCILEVNERLVSTSVNPRTEIEKLISRLILILRGSNNEQ